MPRLIPDPSVKVQTTPAPGPWILWERTRASARQEGLLCTLAACDNPDCPCTDLSLAVYPIDTGLDSVEWGSKSFKVLWRAPLLPEGGRPIHCKVDVYRAKVHSDEDSEYSIEIANRLQSVMTPEVLDRFHDIICTARKLPIGAAVALPEGWEVGDSIDFASTQATARLELVDEAGRTWAALDAHCPRLECPCADTFIDIHRFVQQPLSLHDHLGTIIVKPDGVWDLKPRTREGLVLRDVWRRLQERWGDIPRELARRREIVRGVFGTMVRDAEQKRSTAPKATSASPMTVAETVRGSKAGRNDPWPCGSGRKYKRCCGTVIH